MRHVIRPLHVAAATGRTSEMNINALLRHADATRAWIYPDNASHASKASEFPPELAFGKQSPAGEKEEGREREREREREENGGLAVDQYD